MTVNAITGTKKGRTGIAPTYLHTTLSSHITSSPVRKLPNPVSKWFNAHDKRICLQQCNTRKQHKNQTVNKKHQSINNWS